MSDKWKCSEKRNKRKDVVYIKKNYIFVPEYKYKNQNIMKTLSKTQMNQNMDNGTIDDCSENEKKQIFEFAFGKGYMSSKNKGSKVSY